MTSAIAAGNHKKCNSFRCMLSCGLRLVFILAELDFSTLAVSQFVIQAWSLDILFADVLWKNVPDQNHLPIEIPVSFQKK